MYRTYACVDANRDAKVELVEGKHSVAIGTGCAIAMAVMFAIILAVDFMSVKAELAPRQLRHIRRRRKSRTNRRRRSQWSSQL